MRGKGVGNIGRAYKEAFSGAFVRSSEEDVFYRSDSMERGKST